MKTYYLTLEEQDSDTSENGITTKCEKRAVIRFKLQNRVEGQNTIPMTIEDALADTAWAPSMIKRLFSVILGREIK